MCGPLAALVAPKVEAVAAHAQNRGHDTGSVRPSAPPFISPWLEPRWPASRNLLLPVLSRQATAHPPAEAVGRKRPSRKEAPTPDLPVLSTLPVPGIGSLAPVVPGHLDASHQQKARHSDE